MRSVALALALVVIAGCPRREVARRDDRRSAVMPAAGDPADAGLPRRPGLRLPAGATPIAYDLRLELDPALEAFTGRVAIRVRLDVPADHVWLHLVDLELAAGRYRAGERAGALAILEDGEEMRAFGFGQVLPAGEVMLELEYTGHTARDDEGLFRQHYDGAWFLYSQAESVFARRIVPCFDEPRFKTTWRTVIVAPAQHVALANAPVTAARELADGRRETVFAATGPMPPHLLAVAVGPFTLVDAGRIGRAQLPLRVAVAAGDAKRTTAIAAWAPRLVAALERYVDQPLPLAKLDLVAIPRFFGAMENPGLITFEVTALVGDPADPVFLRRFVRFLAHELAHQWFGNSVTPAWWDDLWLAEAFATWLDDKLSAELGQLDDGPLRTQLARAHALAADRAPGAKPLRRAIATADDAEDAFDAISYEKGAAVLEMFERFVGEERFRSAVRDYLRGAANGSATAADFVAALARATTPAIAQAFAAYLEHPGAPIVELSVACGVGPVVAPVVAIEPRDGATVPVCVRYARPRGSDTACTLATGPTRLALPAATTCPWVIGNADGRGYYHARWARGRPVAPATPAERLAAGQDTAAEVARGEITATAAIAEIRAQLAARDPYATLAALAIAAELDRVVDAATAPAWSRWLALRFAAQMTGAAMLEPQTPIDRALRDAVATLVPGARFDRAAVRAATEVVDRAVQPTGRIRATEFAVAVAVAAPRGGRALFDRVVAGSAATDDPARRDLLLEGLGAFGPELAPRVVELVLDQRFPAVHAWHAVAGMLARTPTRVAAWRAVRDRLPQVLAQLAAVEADDVVEALGGLCDAGSRAEVAATLAPHVDDIAGGAAVVARAVAAIDHCIARRAALGELGPALR